MNSNTNTPGTSQSIRRAVPALAIVVLAIGLGACQTPPRGQAVPEAPVIQPAEVPVGVDRSRPADRIEEAINRLEAKKDVTAADHLGTAIRRLEAQKAQTADQFGSWTARITAQLEYEAQLTKSPSVQYRGRTADTIDRLTSDNDRFAGVPVDRIVEQLEREAAGAPKFY